MSDDDFPTEYDAIVLGTGMAECIAAAALSRIGQKVLHLDRNDYYSGDWACFHLEALQRWISKHTDGLNIDKLELKENSDPKALVEDGESLIGLNVESSSIRNVSEQAFITAERPKTPEPVVKSENTDSFSKGDSRVEASESKATEETPTEPHENPEEKAAEVRDCEEEKAAVDKPQDATSTVSTSSKDGPEDVKEIVEEKKEWTMQDMKSQWRKFNIDLIPKVLYCRGAMVELLISSDIAKYCEFKTITRVLTHINGKLEQVPCSRADVFSSKQVTMIEKRMMMKFLTFAMDYEKQPEEYQGKEDMPFCEYLKSQRLTANVQHYIKQAIAMATDTTTTIEGLVSSQKFLRSLGRYGNTAFLWPVYGAGELPQCFCRMCAVFGGIYCLRRTAQAMIVDKDKACVGIVDTEGKRIKTKYLIMDASYAGQDLLQETGQDKSISRAILVTDRSIQGESEDNITLLSLPTEDGRNVTAYELGSCSYACPQGLYIVHLSCEGSAAGPQADFAGILRKLFKPTQTADAVEDDQRPSVLWSVYFSVQDSSSVALQPGSPDNVYLVAGPDVALDFDQSITQARDIFERICPGEEFLPKAPNPEDIIWDEGEGNTPTDSGFQETTTDGEGNEKVPMEGGQGNEKVPAESGEGNEKEPAEGGEGNEKLPAEGGKGNEKVPAESGEKKEITKDVNESSGAEKGDNKDNGTNKDVQTTDNTVAKEES